MRLSFYITCLIVLTISVLLSSTLETFGMSPGTLTQLQSTSVPSTNIPITRPYFLV
jgi:hypothetical protein